MACGLSLDNNSLRVAERYYFVLFRVDFTVGDGSEGSL